MAKASKKAMWMWGFGRLITPFGASIIASWFLLGCLWLYIAPQPNLSQVILTIVFVIKWLFAGISLIVIFLIFSSVMNAVYKYWSLDFSLEETAIKIVSGFYKKKETYIPYKNIESIDVEMGGGERFWGLATVLIFTSGTGSKSNPDSAEGYIEGLKYSDAVALKDELLKRMGREA